MKVRWSDALEPDGRFSRSQFAFFYFIPILITVAMSLLMQTSLIFGIIAVPWFLFQVFLVIVAGIRRLHDLNRSGWYILFVFVPLANIVIMLSMLFELGKVKGNRWLVK